MSERIIIGVSGSDHAGSAIAWGVEYAVAHGLPIELVHVVDTTWGYADSEFVENAIVAAENRISVEASRIASNHPESAVHGQVLTGSPDQRLIEHARGARTLVVGTRPSRGSETVGIYSRRAARIAERAECTVVVVPSGAMTGSGVVVGVDGSELSLKALRFGAEVAERANESLTAVHAWISPWPWGVDVTASRETPPAEDELVLSESLAGLATDFPDLEVVRSLPRETPVNALYTAAQGARLLAVGSHGRNGLGRVWFGSVSTDMLLTMPTVVAVVR